MSNPDFMRVLRRCAKCGSTNEDVEYSDNFQCYCCDDCYLDMCGVPKDQREEE